MKSLSDSAAKSPVIGTQSEETGSISTETSHTAGVLILRVLRLDVALALAMPVFHAAASAWLQTGQLPLMSLAFLAGAVLCTAVGYQALSAFFDFRQSQRREARSAADQPDTPFAALSSGVLAPALLASLGWLLILVAALCTLWLVLISGWPVLFFAFLSAFLILAALLPPLRYAFRGWGIGELGIALAFGVPPLLGGYYVQAQSLSWIPLMSGLPLVFLILLMLIAQNLATWRRDWRIGKRTLVVMLGRSRALDLSVVLAVGAYIMILLATVVARLPLSYLITLGTAPLVMGVYADIRRSDVTPEDGYRLRNAAAKAVFWTAILASVAFLIGRTGS